MAWLSPKGRKRPCDSSHNINVGDFSLGFTLKKQTTSQLPPPKS